jgi:hypothetical protein
MGIYSLDMADEIGIVSDAAEAPGKTGAFFVKQDRTRGSYG